MQEKSKVCSKCKIEKSVSEFYRKYKNAEYYHSRCKSCKEKQQPSKNIRLPLPIDDENEKWLPAAGRESIYLVSNTGRLFSLYWKNYLPLIISYKGYVVVKAKNEDGSYTSTFLHRIVAQTFIENLHNKKEVNHINGIKRDNRVENLEWATCKENIQAAYDTKIKSNKSEKHPNSLFTNKEVELIREKYKRGAKASELAKELNKKYHTIHKIVTNKNYKVF